VDWKLPLSMPQGDVQPEASNGIDRVPRQLDRPESSTFLRAPTDFTPERRSSARFPLELPAELAAGDVKLKAMTTNVSSGGLLLNCDPEVEIGTLVTVRMNWPVAQRTKQVILVVHGEIIRRQAGGIAIRHRRHEFQVGPQAGASRAQFSWRHHFTPHEH
jgi:hypothetical protein